MPEVTAEDAAIVRAMINAAGLTPPAEEVERLTQLYPTMRKQLASIYAVELDGADPACVFRAGEISAFGQAAPR